MSNTAAPFGFRATRRIDGAAPNYAMMPARLIAQAATFVAGFGDVMQSLSTGYLSLCASTATQAQGIFQGCQYYDTVGQQWRFTNYLPGTQSTNSDYTAFSISDVKQVFEVQSNGAAITTPQIALNATFVTASNGAPNTYSGISTCALDPATVSTNSAFQFTIVGLGQSVGNDNTSSFNTVEVILNNADFNIRTGV
jgi:hypothetical protein